MLVDQTKGHYSVGRKQLEEARNHGREVTDDPRWQKQPQPTAPHRRLSPLTALSLDMYASHKNRCHHQHQRPHHHTDFLPPQLQCGESRSTTEEEKCASVSSSLFCDCDCEGERKEGNFLNGYPTNHEVSRSPQPPQPMAISAQGGREGAGYINFDLPPPSPYSQSSQDKGMCSV